MILFTGVILIVVVVGSALEHYKIGVRPYWHAYDAEIGASSAALAGALDLVDFVNGWIDPTRETVAVAIAFNFHPPCWHLIAEWCLGFKIDWVPCQLDERFPVAVRVGACYIRTPIPNRRRC